MAGEDFERAADLVELAIPALRRVGSTPHCVAGSRRFPDELIRVRPVLSVGYAGALLVDGEIEGVEARLRDAERWLDTSTSKEPVRDHKLIGRDGRCGREGISRSAECDRHVPRRTGADPRRCGRHHDHARRALDLVAEDDHLGRGSPAALLGLAYWTSGDLEAAHRWYADGMASLEKAGHLSDVIGCAIALADIRIAQGRLREAMSTYERGCSLRPSRARRC